MIDFERDWGLLEDLVRFGPSHRHRRRIIVSFCRSLQFRTVLDVGCGSGELLRVLTRTYSCHATGIDASRDVISRNKAANPDIRFLPMDVGTTSLDETFDLVICADMLEHVTSPDRILVNLRKMCRKDLIVTTPAGTPRRVDREFGHRRHFKVDDLRSLLVANGFDVVRSFSWGFPFLAAYRRAINLSPIFFLDRFSAGPYGFGQRLVSEFVNALFYLNVPGVQGPQAYVHARPTPPRV